jgi:hypothetical protein
MQARQASRHVALARSRSGGDDASRMTEPSVPQFPQDAQVCGNCKLWQLHSVDERGWVGPCRIQPGRGLFPPSAPICDAFASKHGNKIVNVVAVPSSSAPRRMQKIAPTIVRKNKPLDSVVELGGDLAITREELMEIFREAVGDAADAPLAAKWEGGTVRLVPNNPELQSKDLSIESLFHKVVMIRDRLRTLEQKINAHAKLSDGEKVEMQHYITRVYGSLTSFNLLFREKSDQFVGSKTDEA